ncbi:hypothetical protein [Arenibaculum sp.]|uniref:hypothetical protein n=1 Tax=Arenibaculum sp. TaxID=2865862 RepID=UPI002E14926B|nr:hypothetical protein [Arenibaculum sp.]
MTNAWLHRVSPVAAVAGALCSAAGFASPAAAQQCPAQISVSSSVPAGPCVDGATGFIKAQQAAVFAWNSFIAYNWPALTATREQPDPAAKFGAGGTTVWQTTRAKVEVYPGTGSAMVGPHGWQKGPPDYGYADPPAYFYSPEKVGTPTGQIEACSGQTPVATPAWVPLDETTQIGNNQTYAGVLPAVDPTGRNSQPQLIRYAVKMNEAFYSYIAQSKFWYGLGTAGAPLDTAVTNYVNQLAQGQSQDPPSPFVEFPTNPAPSFEFKSSWRPLTAQEASSGRFHTDTVRYYEEDAQGKPCYREDVWGLVGLHVISFTQAAPWVVWSTFEQADNILTADGQPTEDPTGKLLGPAPASPTSPALTSDPSQVDPKVVIAGDQGYCTQPGSRLFFRENPFYGTMPSDGNICVDGRWHAISDDIVAINATAHAAISSYLASNGMTSSPWLYYKLVNVQPAPIDKSSVTDANRASYYTANSTIETDYSLGMFSGNLVNGAPSDVVAGPNGTTVPYYNNQLLPFQNRRLGSLAEPLNMGGCAGCHGFAATIGQNFSFALGNNVEKPEAPDAFVHKSAFRDYLSTQAQ